MLQDLQELPLDILSLIIEQVKDRRDLKHLCEVSTTLHHLAVPRLYETITIPAEDEFALEHLDTGPLLRTLSERADLLQYVKAIHFTSIFHKNIGYRCVHSSFEEVEEEVGEWEGEDEDEDKYSRAFGRLRANLKPLLGQLDDGSLRSFSWELGTCIPMEILGHSGYLLRKQNSIQSIRLITGSSCPYNVDGSCTINLSTFRCLRSISWIGLRSVTDFKALRCALQANSTHLAELELDFINWTEANSSWSYDHGRSKNFFARRILRLSTDQNGIKFPALRVLSLSKVSLRSAITEMMYAFNFSWLRSLKLRFCPGAEEFLISVINSGQIIRLTSLELQADIEDEYMDISDTVSTFLKEFEGLEEFLFSDPGPSGTMALWRSMLHHKETLTRFVHHQRVVNLDEDSSDFEELCDLRDLSLFDQDMVELNGSPSQNPLGELNLECIGLCCAPVLLKSILAPFTTKHTLKVLHVRRSGSEIADAADWEVWDEWGLHSPVEGFADGHIRHNRTADHQPDDGLSDGGLSDDGLSDDSEPMGNMSEEDQPDASASDTILSDDDGSGSDTSSGSDGSSMPLSELLQFAQWAFGPEGFPVLQILAFGDLSYQGRFARHNVLLCRNTSTSDIDPRPHQRDRAACKRTFRRMAEKDITLWDLMNDCSRVLNACPTDPILKD